MSEFSSDPPRESSSRKRGRKQKVSFRGNSRNSATRKEEAHRIKDNAIVSEQRRAQREARYTVTTEDLKKALPSVPSVEPNEKRTRLIPASTVGIGSLVSDIYARFAADFRAQNFSIHQFFLCTLAQLEYQLYVANKRMNPFPNRNVEFNFDESWRDVIEYNRTNFQLLVSVIDSFGRFTYRDVDWYTYISDKQDATWYLSLTFSNIADFVVQYAARPGLEPVNCLPGAVFINGRLNNPDDYWPPGFGPGNLRQYFTNFKNVFEVLKNKFINLLSDCAFDGIGKCSALVSTHYRPALPCATQAYVDNRHKRAAMERAATAVRRSRLSFVRSGLFRDDTELPPSTSYKPLYKTIFDASITDDPRDRPPPVFVPNYIEARRADYWTPVEISGIDMLDGVISMLGYHPPGHLVLCPEYALRSEFSAVETRHSSFVTVLEMRTPLVRRVP